MTILSMAAQLLAQQTRVAVGYRLFCKRRAEHLSERLSSLPLHTSLCRRHQSLHDFNGSNYSSQTGGTPFASGYLACSAGPRFTVPDKIS
jgi:hypothetical protein